ncbi:ovostatin-like [Tachyglossus aculeatus]|uniref:ovostatin-like n=1 Tax=Tachyglossus aculeatus TaxID=9261 RepID=UPI0018F6458D|nr:ovostatin-like [Tachyglossus aculeatus]
MWIKILWGVCLLHLTSCQAPETQYVLLVPSVLQSGSLDKACIQLFNLPESVSLSAVLYYQGASTKIFEETVAGKNFFKCGSFLVPEAHPDPLAFITFSAKGNTLNLEERRSVAIRKIERAIFVQSDKPIYKPGQKVLFRVVALDSEFKPVEETYPIITLQDPDQNRIFQWLDVKSTKGIVQLSFQLISEPILGQYSIVAETSTGEKTYHWFTVEEYVLPKFQMTVTAPKTVLVMDPEFKVNVCASYTYGQPVQGRVQLSVCRRDNSYGNCQKNPEGLCRNYDSQLGKDGCVSQVIETKPFEFNRAGYWMSLNAKAVLTEAGTGVQLTESKYIYISSKVARMSFEGMDYVYKQGLPFFGQIKLQEVNDSPIPNEVIRLHLDDKYVGNFTTDKDGIAQFSVDTSKVLLPHVILKATYKTNEDCYGDGWVMPSYPEATYYITRFYSMTNSFLKIVPEEKELKCDQQKMVTVHYLLNKEGFDSTTSSMNFYYLVMVRGEIVLQGQVEKNIHDGLNGTFTISLKVSSDLAPSAVLLVYTLHPRGEMVTDSIRFQVEKCFKNKVNISFSKEQGPPGSNVTLHVTAATESLCALRAVDQSVLLLRPESELSAQSVYNSLHVWDLYGYYFNGLNLDDSKEEPCIQRENIYSNGIYYTPVDADFGRDAYDVVRDMGLKVFTNSHLRKPVLCKKKLEFPERPLPLDELPRIKGGFSAGGSSIIQTVRKFFPETWIWNLIMTNSKGQASLPVTIPDTITEWKASGFCLNDQVGFGISPTTSLTGFQPFFMNLVLPYSVVRGEGFTLKGNVFNYLDYCTQVSSVLSASNDYQAKPLSTGDDDKCICTKEKKSYAWFITPKTLGTTNLTITAETKPNTGACGNETPKPMTGRRDILIKPLFVEPEGIEKEVTQGSLICTKGSPKSEPLALKLPTNLVEGSSRAYFSVLGDILGSAMHNLQNLLRMPYGCGEQNMVLFSPNIYILDYLNQTQQLTEEIKSKAISYLSQGYQKQLSYKHPDGSYSTFGTKDQEGNSWLTAFVYKSFAQAERYIYIDKNVQSQTLIWLLSKQMSNGCFKNTGKLFNNALKSQLLSNGPSGAWSSPSDLPACHPTSEAHNWHGQTWPSCSPSSNGDVEGSRLGHRQIQAQGGLDDQLSFTAYMTAALLEAGHPLSFPAVQKGLQCLEAATNLGVKYIYDQALLAYTFSLAGKEDKRDFFLKELKKTEKKVGGSVHWEREEKPSVEVLPFFFPRAPSAEVEITSYILLAILSKPSLTAEDLSYASQIVQWVAKQQNAYGGFSSTQDTIVALQALTLFQKLTFTKEGQNSVRIVSGKPFEKAFQVDHRNRLLLQQSALPSLPGDYTVEVTGNGCVYVQATLRYNVMQPKQTAGFSLAVQTHNASCNNLLQKKFDLMISASYTGKRNKSNMAIVDVKMLSGYTPVKSSMEKLQNDRTVQRVETKINHVYFYLEDVTRKQIQFSFTIEQDIPVSNIKPASVQLYDYYETDEFALAEYNTPCGQVSQ